MAVPSRVFVGVTVFGLITSLLTVTYTVLVFTGLRPAPLSPVLSFDGADEPGTRVFLILASLFTVGFTVFGWRSLVRGARHDQKRREARAKLVKEQQAYQRRPGGPRGPT